MLTTISHNCKEELRGVDLKATPTRLAVLSFLEKTNKPIDVGTIIEYLKDTYIQADQATIFRIINTFTDKGLIRQIQLHEGKARYELASRADHHHLICKTCGSIEDISDCNIDALEKEIEKKKKFKVLTHSLEFFGICPACRRLASPPAKQSEAARERQ